MSKIAGTPEPIPPPKWLRDIEEAVGVGEENGIAYVDLKLRSDFDEAAFLRDHPGISFAGPTKLTK